MMTTRQRASDPEREAASIRRVLAAAAARPDEVPAPSPFLIPRLQARRAQAGRAPAAAVGALAWRAVPLLLAGLLVLMAWSGVEAGHQPGEDDVAATVEATDLVAEAAGADLPEPREEQP
jgi:hypothetical protein